MTWIELSHPIHAGMVTYPGLPGPTITDHLSREQAEQRYGPGVRFHIGRIEMLANTGTYLDAPYHRYDDGADLADLPLAATLDLAGECVTFRGPGREIRPEDFAGRDLAGKAVLVSTGWSRHFGQPQYGNGYPHLTAAAGELLVRAKITLLGIDSLNVDDDTDPARPVHSALLRAGIPIVEHLRGLEQLSPRGFRFSAVPLRIAGMGSFPVRALARNL